MKSAPNRLNACIAYLPVIGWIYVLILQRKDPFAMFHARQSIGLFLFWIATLLAWVVVGWLLAWIPYGAIFSVALFALVIAAFIFGVVTWIIGLVAALQGRVTLLPIFGGFANRLQI